MDPASDPDEGSVKQKAANSPEVTRGKYFSFCSLVPNSKIPLKPIDWWAPKTIPTPAKHTIRSFEPKSHNACCYLNRLHRQFPQGERTGCCTSRGLPGLGGLEAQKRPIPTILSTRPVALFLQHHS